MIRKIETILSLNADNYEERQSLALRISSDILSVHSKEDFKKLLLERRGIYEENSLFYFPSALFYFLYPISLLLLKNLWINSLEKISFILLPLFYLALIIILRRLFIWHRKTFFVS